MDFAAFEKAQGEAKVQALKQVMQIWRTELLRLANVDVP